MNTNHPKKILTLGECMIELSPEGENRVKLGFAGDTLNTAVYLARYREKTNVDVFYATALGQDPYSQQMLAAWRKEGIQTQLVEQIPDKLPGLYLIQTDAYGERTFYFYRSDSAARQYFYAAPLDKLEAVCVTMDLILFSGVGLAIWDQASQTLLIDLLKKARQAGALICFDSNYRAKLWPDTHLAQQKIQEAWQLSDIYLPTFEDHQALFQDTSPESLAFRLIQEEQLKEVVVKAGGQGCWVGYQQKIHWVPAHALDEKDILDTTGAGDSFNAGYLSARVKGYSPIEAADIGHQLASQVVRFKGAIIPKENMPPLF